MEDEYKEKVGVLDSIILKIDEEVSGILNFLDSKGTQRHLYLNAIQELIVLLLDF